MPEIKVRQFMTCQENGGFRQKVGVKKLTRQNIGTAPSII